MKKLMVVTVRKKYLIFVSLLLAATVMIYVYYEQQVIGAMFYELFSPLYIVDKKIFLDPGHGGEDPGCNDPFLGIYEEDINLQVSQILQNILDKTGAEIILSRDSDKDYVLPKDLRGNQTKKQCDLMARIKMAEDSKAEVFVSLHVNATRKKSYSGAEAFYNPANPYSLLLAQNIQNHLRNIPGMTKRIAKPGSYYLLKNTSMPSVIVEMGYLSNSKEKDLLIKENYQQALALAISRGLVDYFKERSIGVESTAALQALASGTPKVAIIIDDLGTTYNKGVEQIFALQKYPLTLAIMPNLDKTKEHAQRAEKAGFEVLIHMPMEPEHGPSSWLGPGAIKHTMNKEEVRNNLKTALEQLPNAVGMNNHMGSLITQKREMMLPIMEFLRDRQMFYINSRTNDKNVCREVADEIGVPYGERTHFLDDKYDYNSIKTEILRLSEYARKNGYAIGIGHVGPQGLNTAKALSDTLPILEEQGIELVFVSELVLTSVFEE